MVCKWYILPIGGLYATYHLLGEPFQQPLIGDVSMMSQDIIVDKSYASLLLIIVDID